jgi:hypothetical protein
MNFKETDELLEIWRSGEHKEWTEVALDVVKEILLDRLGEIPPEEKVEEEIEEDVSATIPGENTFHNEKNLLNIASWARILSWIILWLYIIVFVLRLISESQDTNQAFVFNISQPYVWLGLLSTPFTGLMYFLILQAIAEGLYMLMDLEENNLQLFKDRNNNRA